MQILKVVFVIIGTLIGAGFASGQEIYTFFYSFGIKGIIGTIISSAIIGTIIYKVLKITKEKNINNYNELLELFVKNKKTREIINIITNIFILLSFYVMVAGFGAYLQQEYKINSIIGSAILAILTYLILKKNIKGIVNINQILIPILIAIIIIIGIINAKNIDINSIINIQEQNKNNWVIISILYARYNSVLIIPMLITLKKYTEKNKTIILASIISTIIIEILLITVYIFLTKIDIDIKTIEMPAVYAIKQIYPKATAIYGIIILISIFTTAISLGISILNNTAKNDKQFNKINLLMCITSVIFSKIGFSNLINTLYPILGIMGIIQIVLIIKQNTKKLLQKQIKTDIT